MAVVFLIGGTGNQLFEFATSEPEDTFSTLLLSRVACRFMKWKHHPQVIEFPQPRLLTHCRAVFLLLLDLILVRLGYKPLFTEFDTHAVQSDPKRRREIAVGYFMLRPFRRSIDPIRTQLERAESKIDTVVAVHVRGGDARAATASGWTNYGQLRPMYFRRALRHATRCLSDDAAVTFFTDDPDYCKGIIQSIGLDLRVSIDTSELKLMMSSSVCADTFIASNSSLSWWIVMLRGKDRTSIVPDPFLRGIQVKVPEFATPLSVNYQ